MSYSCVYAMPVNTEKKEYLHYTVCLADMILIFLFLIYDNTFLVTQYLDENCRDNMPHTHDLAYFTETVYYTAV